MLGASFDERVPLGFSMAEKLPLQPSHLKSWVESVEICVFDDSKTDMLLA